MKCVQNNIFPNSRSEHANKSDLEMTFSFKFRQGMTANLFQQILAACYKLDADSCLSARAELPTLRGGHRVLYAWQSGVLLQCGMTELQIAYNMHGGTKRRL